MKITRTTGQRELNERLLNMIDPAEPYDLLALAEVWIAAGGHFYQLRHTLASLIGSGDLTETGRLIRNNALDHTNPLKL